MKKKIKFLVVLVFCLSIFMSLLIISGCSDSVKKPSAKSYKEVSSLEDLYAMEEEKAYKLTCDLDLQGREWTPLSVKAFDGQGHTIKNCAITSGIDFEHELSFIDKIWSPVFGKNPDYDYRLGFFYFCGWLENVTFDQLKINANCSGSTFYQDCNISFCAATGYSAKNIIVKNSSFVFTKTNDKTTYFGGIIGRFEYSPDGSDVDTMITDCKVENSSVILSGGINYGGGIVSCYGDDISNCTIDNLRVTGSGSGYFGGIVGLTSVSIENCAVKNSTITNMYIIGGIIGRQNCNDSSNYKISGCVVENCNLKYASHIGGLVAYAEYVQISNCLVKDIIIQSKEKNNSVAGVTLNCAKTIRSCLVMDIEMILDNYSDSTKYAFLPVSLGSIVNCGYFDGGKGYDVSSSQTVNSCYSTNELTKTQLLEESDWYNASKVKECFKLDESIWTIENGKLPYINIG